MNLFKRIHGPKVLVSGLVMMLAVWAVPVLTAGPDPKADRAEAARVVNTFGFSLFGEMVRQEQPTANMVISPLSVSTALTMVALGAAGETRDAMKRVLSVEKPDMVQAGRTAGEYLSYLESADKEAALKSFQALWFDRGFQPAKHFKELNRKYFNTETAALDFGDPATVRFINARIAEETGGRVKNMLDNIPSDVVLCLVNAVCFKGVWTRPFKAELTSEAPFVVGHGDTVTCLMMSSGNILAPFFYAAEHGFYLVELPYGDGRFAMDILLPEKDRDLSAITGILNTENWRDWTAGLQADIIRLYLPKFKLESGYQLNNALTNLGMGIAFDPRKADFSLMQENGKRNLWLSRVLHKTVIEVDETGTEAGAAAEVRVAKGPKPRTLMVDRPFLVAVRDTDTGAVLFLARVVDPVR
jgi:serine protease inhibitor